MAEQLTFKMPDTRIGTHADPYVYVIRFASPNGWGVYMPDQVTYAIGSALMYNALDKLAEMAQERGVDIMTITRLGHFISGELDSCTIISPVKSPKDRLMIERVG